MRKRNRSRENSRTLDEDTRAFNFHLNHPFQTNVSRQMDIHYVNCMQRECSGDATAFPRVQDGQVRFCVHVGPYYNVLQHLGANFNTAFIQYSYRITRVREGRGWQREGKGNIPLRPDGKMSCQTLTSLASRPFSYKPNFTDTSYE